MKTKYIRTETKWAKITRNASAKSWDIAIGWNGEFKANSSSEWSFKFVATWKDAEELAAKQLNA